MHIQSDKFQNKRHCFHFKINFLRALLYLFTIQNNSKWLIYFFPKENGENHFPFFMSLILMICLFCLKQIYLFFLTLDSLASVLSMFGGSFDHLSCHAQKKTFQYYFENIVYWPLWSLSCKERLISCDIHASLEACFKLSPSRETDQKLLFFTLDAGEFGFSSHTQRQKISMNIILPIILPFSFKLFRNMTQQRFSIHVVFCIIHMIKWSLRWVTVKCQENKVGNVWKNANCFPQIVLLWRIKKSYILPTTMCYK